MAKIPPAGPVRIRMIEDRHESLRRLLYLGLDGTAVDDRQVSYQMDELLQADARLA